MRCMMEALLSKAKQRFSEYLFNVKTSYQLI